MKRVLMAVAVAALCTTAAQANHKRGGCSTGGCGSSYGYAGGGRRLEEMGVIFGGSRRAQQARIDLMLALGAKMGMPAIRSMFRER